MVLPCAQYVRPYCLLSRPVAALRFGLSYWDVEELLAERGIDVDLVTVHRWLQRFTPLRPLVLGQGLGSCRVRWRFCPWPTNPFH
jgi:hypothetical protein